MISVYEHIMKQRPLTPQEEQRLDYLAKREKKSSYAATYRVVNAEKIKQDRAKWQRSPQGRARKRITDRRYVASDKGRAMARAKSAKYKIDNPENTAAYVQLKKDRRAAIATIEAGLQRLVDKIELWKGIANTRTLLNYEQSRLKFLIKTSTDPNRAATNKEKSKAYRERKGPEWKAQKAKEAKEYRLNNPEKVAETKAKAKAKKLARKEAKQCEQ